MAEQCLCGHDVWQHDDDHGCNGDFGACGCVQFTYLGEEEGNDE